MTCTDNSLMLGFSAPLYRHDGRLYAERQTISGLHAWKENFSRLVAFAICHDGPPPAGWEDAAAGGLTEPGIKLVPIPNTYDLKILFSQRKALSETMLQLMRDTHYHSFAYGGWLGDPGEVAAAVARRHGIAHAVWFDRVESQVMKAEGGSSLKDRLKTAIKMAIMERNEKRAVRGAQLSLLHGATVFNHFKPIARNPHQVEDIHFNADDRLTPGEVAAKVQGAASGPLRIVYCGRAAPMKGPLEWVAALAGLKARGVSFNARWLGDGELLGAMQAAADKAGLTQEDLVFEGFVSDPDRVRAAYRDAHLLMFCHLSDESPRNLIESLHSATPLIGYKDPYSAGLIDEKGAGLLVPRGNPEALADTIAGLDANRGVLATLIRAAGASAEHLTRDSVFRHRSDVIRSQLAA